MYLFCELEMRIITRYDFNATSESEAWGVLLTNPQKSLNH